MDVIKKDLNKIKNISIISVIFMIAIFISAIVKISLYFVEYPETWQSFTIYWTIIGFFILIGTIFDIYLAVKIVKTDWKNEEINLKKRKLGLMNISILGPIPSFIFVKKSNEILENNTSIDN